MQKNTFLAIFLSMLFLILWWSFFQPKTVKPPETKAPALVKTEQAQEININELENAPEYSKKTLSKNLEIPEKEIIIETDKSRIVFTNRGAAVKHWFIKEGNGKITDLVLEDNSSVLSTFPGSNYSVTQPQSKKIVFTHVSPLGWKITKTYIISDAYMHDISIKTEKLKKSSGLPIISLGWGPGLGTDEKELSENTNLTRALGFTETMPSELEKFKNSEYQTEEFKWAAIDNRYFLAAFIFGANKPGKIEVYKQGKKGPLGINLVDSPKTDGITNEYLFKFYAGPKEYSKLKKLGLGLEETVDFGFFGFLGKAVIYVLNYIHNITNNYGWAIIILTIIMQLIVAPLTIKSFKASAAMKQLQPQIKELQEKYKKDPKRLNAEVLNLYKTQKVNPLGGCLPMLLQLPIFWALFTTLRNAYELRGAHWILWVKDLSAPDSIAAIGGIHLNVLPLLMGAGMFLQQKMMTVSTDKMQTQLMYLMPVIFTFMFWSFPSGLVLYWLTNSILTMIEQYFVLVKKPNSPR